MAIAGQQKRLAAELAVSTGGWLKTPRSLSRPKPSGFDGKSHPREAGFIRLSEQVSIARPSCEFIHSHEPMILTQIWCSLTNCIDALTQFRC